MDRKKLWKKILIVVTVPAMCALVWAAFSHEEVETYAKHTLPGIETIASNTGTYDPYIILEVVDSKDDASLGYLVGGEEPIKNGKSIKDYSTEAERTADFPTTLEDMVPATYDNLEGNAFTTSLITTTGSKTVDIKGQYISATDGYYNLVETPASYILYDSGIHTTEQRYDYYIEFYTDVEGEGDYIPTFTQIETSIPDILVDGVTYKNYCKYEIDATNAAVVLDSTTDLSLYDGEEVFDSSLSGYVYKGKIVTQSESGHPDAYLLGANGELYLFGNASDYVGVTLDGKSYEDIPAASGTYQLISFTYNAAAGTHYISSFSKATEDDNTNYIYDGIWFASDEGAYVIGTEASREYVYDPTGTGDLNWQTDYSMAIYDTYSYDGGFENNEWIKKYVFDREDTEVEDFVLDVKTVTMDELNSYDLDTVDLIYFAGIDGDYSADISDAQAIELFTKLIDENFPVLMNRTAYDWVRDNATYPNMDKLALLLAQNTYETFSSSTLLSDWTDAAFVDALPDTVRTPDASYGFNFVNQSFYMYDDTNYTGSGAVPFVNADFLTAFSDGMVSYAFQVILDEIEAENFYIQIAGYSDTMTVEASKANAMRYIINYGYKRNLIKSSISVLEIEPCYSFGYSDEDLGTVCTLNGAASDQTGTTYTTFTDVEIDRFLLTEEYIAENWATQFIDNEENITLTQTYSAEFIGKIEDLNENYDMIYIGLDTSTMNTILQKQTDGTYLKTDSTLYNNEVMDGLIYAHSGDYLENYSTQKMRGLLVPGDWEAEDDNGGVEGFGYYALAGNDITLEKYNQLVEYLDAGYPIVFADGFYNIDGSGTPTVNTYLIDKASYMYKLAQYAIDQGYYGENVNIDSNISNDSTGTGAKEKLADYLNISKLQITMTTIPTVYDNSEGNPAYLASTNGKYWLEYQFILKDDSAVIGGDTNYNVQLYIDTSVDGRYYSDEEITDLLVYELVSGSYTQIYQNSDGKYEMSAGKYYKVLREVPTGYVGVLPWKLQLTRNDNELVRKSVIDYTAISISTSSRETINVLQILSRSGTNWYLSPDHASVDDRFIELLAEVQDFDIQIDYIYANDFIDMGTTDSIATYYGYIEDYDMLIVGFADSFKFTTTTYGDTKNSQLATNAALALRQYIAEGRSVLFTHDTTTYDNIGLWHGIELTKNIRDITGMDRYGVMRGFDDLSLVDTVYDSMYVHGTEQEDNIVYAYDQGYVNQSVVQYCSAGDYLYSTRPGIPGNNYNYNDPNMVEVVNEGQITKYPFEIPDEFQISKTHRQYYQLNLDTDSKDDIKDDDIVVWYCISDISGNDSDIYEAMPNDARNNYYIYNKGNVTYSGVGHSGVNNDTERMLFINTMVAAYNAGVHAPKVTYKDGEEEDANVLEYLYLPYDEALSEYIDTTAEIYFDVADTSFMQGTKQITAYYYLEVDSEGEDTIPVTVDGEEIYLQEFTPTSMTNVRTGESLTGDNIHNVDNDSKYHFTLSPTEIALLSENRANIYVGVKTTYTRNSGAGDIVMTETPYGYYKISILKAQLFEME